MNRSAPTQKVPIPSFDESHTRGLFASLVSPCDWEIELIAKSDEKTPDMWLKKKGSAIVCELKTPELHFNVDRGLFLFSSEYSKIAKQIHKSVKQFRSFDGDHGYPWLVVFASYNFQLSFDSLLNALKGGFAPGDGNSYPPGYNGSRPHKQILNDIKYVDAILWLQADADGARIYSAVLAVLQGASYLSEFDVLAADMEGVADGLSFSFGRTEFVS